MLFDTCAPKLFIYPALIFAKGVVVSDLDPLLTSQITFGSCWTSEKLCRWLLGVEIELAKSSSNFRGRNFSLRGVGCKDPNLHI